MLSELYQKLVYFLLKLELSEKYFEKIENYNLNILDL